MPTAIHLWLTKQNETVEKTEQSRDWTKCRLNKIETEQNETEQNETVEKCRLNIPEYFEQNETEQIMRMNKMSTEQNEIWLSKWDFCNKMRLNKPLRL